MGKKNYIKFIFPVIALITFALFSAPGKVFAKADNDFSGKFGLIVHNINKDQTVPRIKALKVLLKYFSETRAETTKKIIGFEDIKESDMESIKNACSLNLMDCSRDYFYPTKNITQIDFLDWFFKLKYVDHPDFLRKKYANLKNPFFYTWLEAKSLNIGTESEITYSYLREFLYKNKISESNSNRPYVDGLTLNDEEISTDEYHSLKEIDFIKKNLQTAINSFEGKKQSKEDKGYLDNLQKTLKSFEELSKSLAKAPYPLKKYPELNPEVTKYVRQYGLQDVLFAYSYDYSKNPAYRQHNLTTGTEKMNGKVFMPDEVIDYWKILSDKGLSDFVNGWSIVGGEEVWEFGGGICGSATNVFVPSWMSGLEIVERKNHSSFYRSLYPVEYIGLDSTVYRPRPNLKIKNNTGEPIVFSVENDKKNKVITVRIIGNKPYKEIRTQGPIYLGKKYIKWVRQIEDFDGKITTDELESRYNAIY